MNGFLRTAKCLMRRRVPGQLVIQVTDRCNARCPQCGMRVGQPFARTSLSDAQVRHILDAAAENGVAAVSFTGGEPMLLFREVAGWIEHAAEKGIAYIRTGTNGFFFRNFNAPGFEEKIDGMACRLAAAGLRNFWISLDSCIPEVHEKMRGFDGVVEGIRRALPIFHAQGIYPAANLGINRNLGGSSTRNLSPAGFSSPDDYLEAFASAYRNALCRFYRFVIDLGFTMVNTCYPMSVGDEETKDGLEPVYAATAVDEVVRFSPAEKRRLFRTLREVIGIFRSQLRIFSPLVSLYALERQYAGTPEKSAPCRGGVDFFFVDAKDGNAYPCGYRGNESFGPYRASMPHAPADEACRRCDWECFRDPSELFWPLLAAVNRPLGLFADIIRDPFRFKLWAKDLLYYRACGFFNGRKPPDYRKLRWFAPP
jgi:MoaA/NifB/PqqE/SkfB family radical SAM enzyme